MHVIWSGLLSKAVMLQEEYGSKDLRFFGISIGWLAFGFMVGIDRQPTKHATDEVTTCPKCGYDEFWGGRCHVVGCGSKTN